MKFSEPDGAKHRDGLNGVDQQFVNRWSPRSMSGRALSKDQMAGLVEAARWSPSCFNLQPWRFIYSLKDDDYWEKFLGLLIDVNRLWAQRAGAVVILLSIDRSSELEDLSPTAAFDTGSAWMSLALQAQAMGLVSHAMWGFHHEAVAEVINMPSNMSARAMIAIGYPGDPADLPEKYQDRESPSSREPLESLMFQGFWIDPS